MEKVYDQTKVEPKWYDIWEKAGYFQPEINPEGKPYTIILPPPNANAPLHFGHALYTVEDILIRYHRMKGEAALWLPGSDHAGFETQVVFEKHLEKTGKSRFDFDRETLYKMIWDFVQANKGTMEGQLRKLGFSVDWSREKFTLDPDIVKVVYKTFKKLFNDGLAYRGLRLVNYCTRHGTSFSDLEVIYEDRTTPLYYIKYGPLTLATVRLETKFGDTAVAVHPDDKRYQKYIGETLSIETVLGPAKIKVIADKAVDPNFGTGVIKVTPAHAPIDFEIGQRHNLEIRQVIGFDGRLNEKAGKFAGMRVKEARKAIAVEMQEKGLIEKMDENYKNRVGVCYKCGTEIEPLPLEQWFLKMDGLAKTAIEAVNGERSRTIKIVPKNWETTYFNWLENLKDWNISRQIVWGMQIPAWRCIKCSEVKSQKSKVKTTTKSSKLNNTIWIVTEGEKPEKCPDCGSAQLEQDPDVFDTWFSSGQWPFATLQSTKPEDFDKFYPTSVMETGYDILLFWVARMVMLGIYITGKIPFKDILLHGKVLDPLGKKMSKSKGNVVDPIEIANLYGADALRMALMYGNAFGHDQALSHPKLQAMRNFTNKLWNIGRFIIDFAPEDAKHLNPTAVILGRDPVSKYGVNSATTPESTNHTDSGLTTFARMTGKNEDDKQILEKLSQTIKTVTKALDSYRFHDGSDALYEFIWHEFADKYIESTKDRRAQAQPVLEYVFRTSLELLHPFMPFITEELWQKLPHEGKTIMVTKWPNNINT
ncbi:valine--tRNA ligase [Candidatus Daviesbacteria bacterium]|nr:valine--tRNA ligase [Candidatus Daviesbacteria bacterium]